LLYFYHRSRIAINRKEKKGDVSRRNREIGCLILLFVAIGLMGSPWINTVPFTNEFVIRDYVASVRPRGEPFRSRSMVLWLAGHHPVLSIGGNARRQGLKTTFALLCPRSLGLTPRSLFGYSIVDSLITRIPQLKHQARWNPGVAKASDCESSSHFAVWHFVLKRLDFPSKHR
jgi:hypothetical protein